MKTKGLLSLVLFVLAVTGSAQSLVGTWQVTEEKTCFDSQIKESDTEKELRQSMGSTKTGVARVIQFNKNGTGEEAVFATGSKKGSGKTNFKYRYVDSTLQLLDKKSRIMTQHLIVDELTATTLRIHIASKACETKTFTRIK
jgi:hypothetical protein